MSQPTILNNLIGSIPTNKNSLRAKKFEERNLKLSESNSPKVYAKTYFTTPKGIVEMKVVNSCLKENSYCSESPDNTYKIYLSESVDGKISAQPRAMLKLNVQGPIYYGSLSQFDCVAYYVASMITKHYSITLPNDSYIPYHYIQHILNVYVPNAGNFYPTLEVYLYKPTPQLSSDVTINFMNAISYYGNFNNWCFVNGLGFVSTTPTVSFPAPNQQYWDGYAAGFQGGKVLGKGVGYQAGLGISKNNSYNAGFVSGFNEKFNIPCSTTTLPTTKTLPAPTTILTTPILSSTSTLPTNFYTPTTLNSNSFTSQPNTNNNNLTSTLTFPIIGTVAGAFVLGALFSHAQKWLCNKSTSCFKVQVNLRDEVPRASRIHNTQVQNTVALELPNKSNAALR